MRRILDECYFYIPYTNLKEIIVVINSLNISVLVKNEILLAFKSGLISIPTEIGGKINRGFYLAISKKFKQKLYFTNYGNVTFIIFKFIIKIWIFVFICFQY